MRAKELKQNLDVLVHISEFLKEQQNNNKGNLDIELLSLYSGFGSVSYFSIPIHVEEFIKNPSLLDKYPFASEAIKDYFVESFRKISENTSADRAETLKKQLAESSLTAFYTPKELIDEQVYFALKSSADRINSGKRFNILEPSCGNGRYFQSIRTQFNLLHEENILDYSFEEVISSKKLGIVGVEIDVIASFIAKEIYPDTHIVTKPLQKVDFRNIKFDLIVGNIPFSNTKVYAPEFREKKEKPNLHQYFFYKNLSLLKEEGVLSFITSSAIADNNVNLSLREYIVNNSELLSNIRLPSNTFENTSVVSDLITLKKANSIKIGERQALYASPSTVFESSHFNNEKELKINPFFQQHPEMVIGNPFYNKMHGSDSLSFHFDGEKLELWESVKNKLEKKIEVENLQKENFKEVVTLEKGLKKEKAQLNLFDSLDSEEKKYTESFLKEKNYIEDTIVIFDEISKPGIFSKEAHSGNYIFEELDRSDSDISIIQEYISLRDIYVNLFSIDEFSQKKEALHKDLILKHKYFIDTYDFLNKKENVKLFINDKYFSEIRTLETVHKETGKIGLSEILTNPNYFSPLKAEKITSHEDALLYSLSTYNEINFDFLSRNFDKTEEEIQKDLIEQELIFFNPLVNEFETKDKFLSGDLFSKIDSLENMEIPEWFSDISKENHLALLEENKNTWISFDEITIQLGNSWLNKKHYENFISNLVQKNTHIRMLASEVRFKIEGKEDTFESSQFAIRNSNGRLACTGIKLLEDALNNTVREFKYKDERGAVHKDVIAFKKAQQKIQFVEMKWSNYLAGLSVEERTEIEYFYNYKYNNYVIREYNADFLKFQLGSGIQLKPHQKNAVYQILQEDGVILDHSVGAGKTFVMAVAAQRMKELGIKRKPVIAALRSNVKDIYSDYKKLYPNAKILYEQPNLSNPKAKKEYLAKIANQDWDCIIMKHTTLAGIPAPPDIEMKYLKSELSKMRADFDFLSEGNVSKKELNGLTKRIQNRESRIEELNEILRDKKIDSIYNINTIGIDHIFVDESHIFKNLGINTIHQRVAGLGSKVGSQRAVQLKLLTMSLQEKVGIDKGLTLASGTVISNSMAEMYNVLYLKSPHLLEKHSIFSFDSFAKLFAVKSIEYELNVTGDFKLKERFREFTNMPELMRLYKKCANVINSHNLNQSNKPKLKTKLISIEPNEKQLKFNTKLIEFAENERGDLLSDIVGKTYNEQQMSAKMLICTNLSKKASIDMRLVNDRFEAPVNGKIDVMCKNVADYYFKFKEKKGTQIIFSDIGTPKKSGEFNIYDEVKENLFHNYKIPLEEIAFIHDYETEKSREELFPKIREGKIRVIIGSTQKLGTGVNIQDRCVAIHNLDIPWKPSDMEQRNGRGARQGNWVAHQYNNNEITSYVYGTKKSLDSYNFQILQNKANFINQVKDGSVLQRKFNEGDVGEDGEVSYATFSASLSGNTEIIEKIKVEKELEKLIFKKNYIKNELEKNKRNQEHFEKQIENLEKHLSYIDSLEKDFQQTFPSLEEGAFSVLIEGKNYELKAANTIVYDTYINSAFLPINQEKELCKIGPFTMYLRNEEDKIFSREKKAMIYIKNESSGISYMKSRSGLPKENTALVLPNTLDNVIKAKEKQVEQLSRYKDKITYYNTVKKDLIFPEESENKIVQLRNRNSFLDKEIERKTKKGKGPKIS